MRRVMDGIPQGKPCPESVITEQGLQKAVNDCLSQFPDSIVAKMLPPPPPPSIKVTSCEVTEHTDAHMEGEGTYSTFRELLDAASIGTKFTESHTHTSKSKSCNPH